MVMCLSHEKCVKTIALLISLTLTQNAPQKFQVILVATDTKSEESALNLEIARQFAKEKQMELHLCDIEEQESVDSTFLALIQMIMSSWEENNVSGTYE